jgi:dihydroorotate dehydrogenase electron transfer subunit
MKLKPAKIGNMTIDPIFVIPAGVITTTPDTCEKFSKEVYVGAVVTKSIPPRPRLGNREPIIAQVNPNTFINAVGYTSAGSKEIFKEFSEISPEKPIIASITAPSTKGFEYLARNVREPFSSIEAVISCPHTKGYGVEGGFNSPDITYEVTEAVVKKSNGLPVIVKLPPDTSKIKDLAIAAKNAGASALSGVNTIRGTVIDGYTGKHILTNKYGGLSGEGVSGIGVECISLMRKAVKDMPIIGGLGNESARIGRQYLHAGADVLHIGTALRGITTKQINEFFRKYEADLLNDTNEAEKMVTKEWIMKYEPFKITNIEKKGEEIKIFTFDKKIKAEPGQFAFLWIPGKAEKPFSIAYNDPLTIAVRKLGKFTSRTFELEIGDEIMAREPYGQPFPITNDESILVGGGTGLAPLYFLAKKLKNPKIFMGAKTEKELLFEREFSELGEVIISTDNGSKGRKEFVTDSLERYLCENATSKHPWFYNCGPEIMMKKAVEIESSYTLPERIFASVERYTPCGIGICGRCSMDGSRTCVDGPVYNALFLKNSKDFGNSKRDVRGIKIQI